MIVLWYNLYVEALKKQLSDWIGESLHRSIFKALMGATLAVTSFSVAIGNYFDILGSDTLQRFDETYWFIQIIILFGASWLLLHIAFCINFSRYINRYYKIKSTLGVLFFYFLAVINVPNYINYWDLLNPYYIILSYIYRAGFSDYGDVFCDFLMRVPIPTLIFIYVFEVMLTGRLIVWRWRLTWALCIATLLVTVRVPVVAQLNVEQWDNMTFGLESFADIYPYKEVGFNQHADFSHSRANEVYLNKIKSKLHNDVEFSYIQFEQIKSISKMFAETSDLLIEVRPQVANAPWSTDKPALPIKISSGQFGKAIQQIAQNCSGKLRVSRAYENSVSPQPIFSSGWKQFVPINGSREGNTKTFKPVFGILPGNHMLRNALIGISPTFPMNSVQKFGDNVTLQPQWGYNHLRDSSEWNHDTGFNHDSVELVSDNPVRIAIDGSNVDIIFEPKCNTAVTIALGIPFSSGSDLYLFSIRRLGYAGFFDIPANTRIKFIDRFWKIPPQGRYASLNSGLISGSLIVNGEKREVKMGEDVGMQNVSVIDNGQFVARSSAVRYGNHMLSKKLLVFLSLEYWTAIASLVAAYIALMQFTQKKPQLRRSKKPKE